MELAVCDEEISLEACAKVIQVSENTFVSFHSRSWENLSAYFIVLVHVSHDEV